MKPGSVKWQGKIADMQLQEMLTEDFRWWLLSFCDGDQPEGQQFLGACIVQAWGIGTAIAEATRRKINPGGEVLGMPVSDNAPEPLPEWTNRLLTRTECEAFDQSMLEQKT